MADLSHLYGGDLQIGAGGDLSLAAGAALGQQRILRRLLTNPSDDIWHLGYGAGLARYVGQTTQLGAIGGVIRAQLARESSVATQPVPQVNATERDGLVLADIAYTDTATGSPQMIALPIGD